MAIEKAVLSPRSVSATAMDQFGIGGDAAGGREITPPEWAPWTLMSLGAVVLLYSFTLPRRVRQP